MKSRRTACQTNWSSLALKSPQMYVNRGLLIMYKLSLTMVSWAGNEDPLPSPPWSLHWIGCTRLCWLSQKRTSPSGPLHYHWTVSLDPYKFIVVGYLISGSGIYVPNDERWPEKFRGIGIRIEDSVCVGDEDPIILSPEAVKEVGNLTNMGPQSKLPLTDVFGRSKILRHYASRTPRNP